MVSLFPSCLVLVLGQRFFKYLKIGLAESSLDLVAVRGPMQELALVALDDWALFPAGTVLVLSLFFFLTPLDQLRLF